MKVNPRRRYNEDDPTGYMESDKDFISNNLFLAVELLEAEVLKEAKELWLQFGDIPVSDNDLIELPFLHFPVGINRFEVWRWFEHTFDISVAKDLMFPTSEKP